MKRTQVLVSAVLLALGIAMLAFANDQHVPATQPTTTAREARKVDPAELDQARLRARLLHETIHGALQVMHRDFFRDGTGRVPIPSDSLEDVFTELEKTFHVNVRWLAVTADAMNPRHRAETPFEKQAVEALAKGNDRFDSTDTDGTYRYAGEIVLGNQCLKCHVPGRKSLEDRKAAVVISMPVNLLDRMGTKPEPVKDN